MRRKLICQRGSFTLTLPKDWAKANNLKPGDEIDINEIQGELIINSPNYSAEKEYVEDISTYSDRFLRNLLNQLYNSNYTKIILITKNKKQITLIKKLTSLFLVGFEIISTKNNRIILEVLIQSKIENFEKFLSKLISCVSYSFEINNSNELKRITKKTTQYKNLCKRLLSSSVKDGKKIAYSELFAFLCEINHILFHSAEKKIKKRKIKKAFELIIKGLRTNNLDVVNLGQEMIPNNNTLERAVYNLSNVVIAVIVAEPK